MGDKKRLPAGARKSPHLRRVGASTLEFALVAPVIFLVVLALFQFASLMMSQNVLTNAAREGGRVASLPGTTSANTVILAVQDYLQRGGVNPSSVTVNVTPASLSDVDSGDELRISVSAPISGLAWIWALAPPGGNLSAEATYTRE